MYHSQWCGERTKFPSNNTFRSTSIRSLGTISVTRWSETQLAVSTNEKHRKSSSTTYAIDWPNKDQSQVTHKSQLFLRFYVNYNAQWQRGLNEVADHCALADKKNSMLNHDFSVSLWFFFSFPRAATQFRLDEAKIAYNAANVSRNFVGDCLFAARPICSRFGHF